MLKNQIYRFILIGILNTSFGYCLYALFIFFGLDYFSALAFATIIGIIFNFQTIGRLVFKQYKHSLILKFLIAYGLVFLVNLVLIKLLISLGFNEYLSGAIAIFPAAALSFILNKFFVFKR